jgi:hypothetical protein
LRSQKEQAASQEATLLRAQAHKHKPTFTHPHEKMYKWAQCNYTGKIKAAKRINFYIVNI